MNQILQLYGPEAEEISLVSFCFGLLSEVSYSDFANQKVVDITKLFTWMFWFSLSNIKLHSFLNEWHKATMFHWIFGNCGFHDLPLY